jgi:ribosomal protein L11 methyltransferase
MEAQVQYRLYCNDFALAEAIPAMLQDLPFSTFRWENGAWYCACPVSKDPGADGISEACPFIDNIHSELLQPENYNAVWEASVKPIILEERVYIRPPSYPPPSEEFIDICINPQMTFGTGHHETTALIMRRLLSLDLKGKQILDMGCGTGVLSILALKLGAEHLLAVDIDAMACEVANELLQLNCGDSSREVRLSEKVPDDIRPDIILANIHLQVLIGQRNAYFSILKPGGRLLVSGILFSQEEQLIDSYGREPVYRDRDGQWVMLEFECE